MADELKPGGPITGEPPQPAGGIPEKFLDPVTKQPRVDDLAKAYRELEQEKGRLGNELGAVRKTKEELEGFYRENLVIDRETNTVMTKTEYQRLQDAKNKEPSKAPADLDMLIQDTWANKPSQVVQALVRESEMAAYRRNVERSKALNAPSISKIVAENPDVLEAAEKLEFEQGLSFKDAIAYAYGQKMLQGGEPNPGPQPVPIPSVLFNATQNASRTFMPTGGKPSTSVDDGKPKLTPDELAMANVFKRDPERVALFKEVKQ